MPRGAHIRSFDWSYPRFKPALRLWIADLYTPAGSPDGGGIPGAPEPSKYAAQRGMLGVLCGLVLCGILVAGLWPFHAPLNEVSWLTKTNGLRFGRHGTVMSSGPLPASAIGAASAVEMWVKPSLSNKFHTLLAFSSPEHPRQFLVRRYQSGVVLRSEASIHSTVPEIYVANVFRSGEPVMLTISSGTRGTATYANGALLNNSSFFRFSSSDFATQLVFGTSPVDNDAWSGELLGLALYGQELSAAEVHRHFQSWTTKGRPDISENERVLALYLLDERQGRTVHDRTGSGIDLHIPERYTILREKFLAAPWDEFQPDWSYWTSFLINVGGFIPLGFIFCAYLTTAGKVSRPALMTIILGSAVSITIEVLQAYLPTRDSGMTDIITNTLGTALGVWLFRWKGNLLAETLNRITVSA